MKYRYLYLVLLLILFSCSKEIDFTESKGGTSHSIGRTSQPIGRTILVYIAGDNSLTNEVNVMHTELMQGWNPKTMGSLIVFADRKNSDPVLIKFKQRDNKTISDTLRRYPNENSATPELFSKVMDDTRLLAPASSYGMILFSHATGWLPAKAFLNPAKWGAALDDGPQIVPRSIFEDQGREMELADFAAAIPDGMFEFIASEMCFMSSVETGYALRNKTKYLLASAPEVLSPGFTPLYTTSLDLLYMPQPDLKGFAQAFFDYFNGLQGAYKSAAISLVRTSEMESLAALTREINLSLSQDQIDQVQYYDRQGKPHVFFDFGDYINHAATAEQASQMNVLLDKAVIFKLNTPKLINIDINKHSGLSVYIPQASLPRLNKAYEDTDWYKAITN